MILRKLCIMIAAICLTISVASAMPTTPERLTFEVVSIKLSQPGVKIYTIKPLPGGTGYTAQNAPVKLMISLMYKVPMRQIVGGPDWINTDPFDVEARADHSSSVDDLHAMFQNLLADRFHLKYHMETREGPVYAMTAGTFKGTQVPMKYLTWWLGQQLQNDGRPVVDETGLSESYDFTLSFAPELPPNVSRDNLPPEMQELPSIFEGVKQQLGLKLEPTRGPVDYFVIDHIEKPSAN